MLNITNASNVVNTHEAMKYANEISGGLLGPGILLVAFIIILAASAKFGINRSLSAAAIITAILASIFKVAGYIDTKIFMIFFIIAAASSILWFQDSE